MLRGIPIVNVERCLACGACAYACPVDAVSIQYTNDKAILTFNYARCIRCTYCRDKCPVGAIDITDRYGIVADSVENLYGKFEILLAKCSQCENALTHSERALSIVREKTPIENVLCQRCKIEKLGKNIPWMRT